MLYFLIIEHRCTLLPTRVLIPLSSSSPTLKLASESLLIIDACFAIPLTSLNTLLFRGFDRALMRLTLFCPLLTSRLDARTNIEVPATAGAGRDIRPVKGLLAEGRPTATSAPFYTSLMDPGANGLWSVATFKALMLIFREKSSFKSSSFRSVSSAVANSYSLNLSSDSSTNFYCWAKIDFLCS